VKIEIVKTDISDSLKYNTSITVELLRSNDLWKIEVPHTIENNELIHQLSSADDLVDKYAKILSDEFQAYNYKNEYKSIKKRFICSTSIQLNKAVVLPSTVDISDDFEKYGIKRKSWYGDNYFYRGFGTVVDGELLSWCLENSHFLEDGSTEIGVATDENHRQKGYAVSNVAALCDCLLNNGVSKIYYECAPDNIASFCTAKKANLEYVGDVFYLGFRKEKN